MVGLTDPTATAAGSSNNSHAHNLASALFCCADSVRLRDFTFDSITRTLNSTPWDSIRC